LLATYDFYSSLNTFQLSVPVAFFGSDHEAFSDCAGFPYDFQLNDQRTFSVVSKGPIVPQESANSACTTISLVNKHIIHNIAHYHIMIMTCIKFSELSSFVNDTSSSGPK
jgi:hypothetical protein